MALHWILTFRCANCGAKIQYEDERPAWFVDEERAEGIKRAQEYVADHQGQKPKEPECEPAPPYVVWNFLANTISVEAVDLSYTECPACDDRIYWSDIAGSGNQE